MDHEFQLNIQLKQMELDSAKSKETQKEEQKLQDIIDRAKSPKPKQSNIKE